MFVHRTLFDLRKQQRFRGVRGALWPQPAVRPAKAAALSRGVEYSASPARPPACEKRCRANACHRTPRRSALAGALRLGAAIAMGAKRVLPWEPCTPTALRLGRALNGRGRACAARKAARHGAGAFAASPALLQSAAMGEAGRWHLNPGLNLQAFQGA